MSVSPDASYGAVARLALLQKTDQFRPPNHGPAGGTAALALATYGVNHIVITKYRWTANTPRAHITNQRTMEVFRDLGIESDMALQSTPHQFMGDTVFCTSLTGDEFGRVRTWLTRPDREGDHLAYSPCANCDIPQTYLEPVILGKAAERGSRIFFNTEYLGLQQDDTGVTVSVRDRLSGREYTIRAKYVIGADGAKSQIASDIELPFSGEMDIAGNMNIVFDADLTHLVAHRPSVLYLILQSGHNGGPVGLGVIRMVRRWNEWLAIWGYDVNNPPAHVSDEEATKIVHRLLGDPSIDVKIKSTSLWRNNKCHATQFTSGRVFCAGDAVHRHPPTNGLGSNTSVQDSYNLAWKLALVLQGRAGPGLLQTFDEERVPVGKQIVHRAYKSTEEYGPIVVALGVVGTDDPEVIKTRIASRYDDTDEGFERREAVRKALEAKDYEFNTHGVEMGQRYASRAVVPDGTPEPGYTKDPELYYHPTTWPGARLPHVWLVETASGSRKKISTLDLPGKGLMFALLTGIAGAATWVPAAKAVSAVLCVEVKPAVIGPGREYLDVYDDWARAREVEESGCVLVRPDGYVGWRSAKKVDGAAKLLESVMRQILDRA
ncbi:2,4-dichlorophenol 6-monooxygenase [Gonapodya prolifera JEL478]|uniref:2,4-dichlorophenol 6-monooxygenase n=1 Tax=Gonapodya prolifera (strain JEL478) TaxID=1344416 RepID=A0A139A3C2_GONPJ|nr:2,4-dichlorophenol 6-monooxygenase [Gonapodya prolifera JEL478]|eukprot:KXS10883.1 2,4-dichlorophenol 6-monooxygenase [Gonapodya prolifera JEL478]